MLWNIKGTISGCSPIFSLFHSIWWFFFFVHAAPHSISIKWKLFSLNRTFFRSSFDQPLTNSSITSHIIRINLILLSCFGIFVQQLFFNRKLLKNTSNVRLHYIEMTIYFLHNTKMTIYLPSTDAACFCGRTKIIAPQTKTTSSIIKKSLTKNKIHLFRKFLCR